jgi:hypothetical protein
VQYCITVPAGRHDRRPSTAREAPARARNCVLDLSLTATAVAVQLAQQRRGPAVTLTPWPLSGRPRVVMMCSRLALLLPAVLLALTSVPAAAQQQPATGDSIATGAAAVAAAGHGGAMAASSALYYKLSEVDIGGKRWPSEFLKYSILVADPGLTPAQLAVVRRDLPGRKLIAYTCMGWAYVQTPCTNCTGPKCSGCPGSRCVDRLDSAGRPYWNSSYNVRNRHDGKAICPFGHLHSAVTPVAAWIPTRESVDAMVRFHSEVTLLGYDGVRVGLTPD